MTRNEIAEAIKSGKMCKNSLNGDEGLDFISGCYFADLMYRASIVFGSYLILGGSYRINNEDKMLVLSHLQEIMHIVEKYNME